MLMRWLYSQINMFHYNWSHEIFPDELSLLVLFTFLTPRLTPASYTTAVRQLCYFRERWTNISHLNSVEKTSFQPAVIKQPPLLPPPPPPTSSISIRWIAFVFPVFAHSCVMYVGVRFVVFVQTKHQQSLICLCRS